MEDRIKNTMAEILEIDPASIQEDSSPATIKSWDSLRHMNLILALEEEFGVQFEGEQLATMLSLKVIKQRLLEKLN